MSDAKMVKKTGRNVFEELEKFHDTSIFKYIRKRDWKNVVAKLAYYYFYPLRRAPRNIERWFAFRTYDKYHLVDTGLRPGYYDKDFLLLHGSFNLLKDFVEVELAWSQLHTLEKNFKWPNNERKHVRKFGNELGLAHLDYWNHISEEQFAEDYYCCDVKNKANWGEEEQKNWDDAVKSLHEIRAQDKEIRDLYLWWTRDRPNRPDPYKTTKDKDYTGALDLENKYYQEDTDMLCRLMKIRFKLWT